MELFVGLDFPPAIIKELQNIQTQLRATDPVGHYESEENFHLTLRYVGEVSAIEPIARHLEQIHGKRFRLELQRLGLFDNPEGNVVWVDVVESNDELNTLQRQIDRAISNSGAEVKQYPFVPHISLAYGSGASIAEAFPSCHVTPLSFEVSEFYLYEVMTMATGSRFRKIYPFQLD